MRLVGFLLGREEDLKHVGLNARLLTSSLALGIFLLFHASSLSLLGTRLFCSSSTVSERVILFIEVKQSLLLYMWLITAVSWAISSTAVGILVIRKVSMRLRKFHYRMGMCSLTLALPSALTAMVLGLSPGRVIDCEGSSWKELLIRVFSEIMSYLASFPPVISVLVTLGSLVWFTYLAFRIYRVTLGLPRREALRYSLGFTGIFVGLIFLISLLSALLIVLLP